MSHGYFDDEYDPLAPPRYDDVADDARPGVSSGVWGAGDDAGFGDADRGIGDGTGLARVWFDEGWLPRKVRLNTTWGARIRSGRDLADAFERIFSLARTASQEASATGADEALGLSPELPSEVSLGVYSVEEYLTVLHTHAAFYRGLEREPVPGPADGQVGRFQGVWVATDSLGWPVEVDCDDSWLDRVNSAQVGAALIRATASAREKFAELAGTTVSAREEVLAEQELLLAGLWNIAARKGHR